MRIRKMMVFLFGLFFLVAFLSTTKQVFGQHSIKYDVSVEADGTAVWAVREAGIGLNTSSEVFRSFRNNVTRLVVTASLITGRNMTASDFRFTVDASDVYIVIRYQFTWENFGLANQSEIAIGDVFQVEAFFLKLRGDGEFFLTYPSQFIVKSVFPEPYALNSTLSSLDWLGTEEFRTETPRIILKEQFSPFSLTAFFGENAVPITGLIVALSGFSASLYVLKRRRKGFSIGKQPSVPEFPMMEDDEEKVLSLLRSSHGALRQSVIAEQLRFSKAKASQLLTSLEKRGVITRHKKGRDKIAVLAKT